MKVSLVVADGLNRGRSIPVRGGLLRVGRDPDCQLRANSESISRRHCEIVVTDEVVLIRDLGSTNGTFFNGEVVGESGSELRHGDRLEFGPLRFVLRMMATPSQADQPTELVGADGTQVGKSIQADATGHDSEVGSTRAEEPVPSSEASTGNVKPPVSSEGISEAASSLIKKMLAKAPRRPRGGRR